MRKSVKRTATMIASRYSRMATSEVRLSPTGSAAGPSATAVRCGKLKASRASVRMPTRPRRSSGDTARLTGSFLLFDAGGLADLFAQVVQPAPAHDSVLTDFNAVDARTVQQKRFFNADTVRDSSYGDRLLCSAAFANRHDAFEHLNALFAAFNDLGIDLDGI